MFLLTSFVVLVFIAFKDIKAPWGNCYITTILCSLYTCPCSWLVTYCKVRLFHVNTFIIRLKTHRVIHWGNTHLHPASCDVMMSSCTCWTLSVVQMLAGKWGSRFSQHLCSPLSKAATWQQFGVVLWPECAAVCVWEALNVRGCLEGAFHGQLVGRKCVGPGRLRKQLVMVLACAHTVYVHTTCMQWRTLCMHTPVSAECVHTGAAHGAYTRLGAGSWVFSVGLWVLLLEGSFVLWAVPGCRRKSCWNQCVRTRPSTWTSALT